VENTEFIYAFMATWIGTLAGIFGITKFYEWREKRNGNKNSAGGPRGNNEDPSV
jgi:hypothetical protein